MTLLEARQILSLHALVGGSYNKSCARKILKEVQQCFGDEQVRQLIRELDLTSRLGFQEDVGFSNPSTN